MKIDSFKSLNVRNLSGKQLEKYRNYIVGQYTKTQQNFQKNKLKPDLLTKTNKELGHISRIRNQETKMRREINAIRSFYFTRVPGNRELTRTKSSTVKGYKSILRQTGKTLGIKGYAKWTEKQRKDLWKVIDQVKELGPEFFMPEGFSGDYLYQSGTTFKTIEVIIEELGETDPVKIIEQLRRRIDAVQNGNQMSDREFFGQEEERFV